ncbi:MAG: amidohydrolase [Zoogloeaceae bacterium]|jgi:hippurate hydrolase|nr:amidohydrolase [Zoogloeaceae bacterium]
MLRREPLSLPFLSELIALRRDLHKYPELAFQEERTADRVARELERYGLAVSRGLAKTGVVGVLRAKSGRRMIGLRADMDALPLAEENQFAHRSAHTGCMHACGHDGHTAMLLGAARYLAEHPDFDGTVVFIFQPAEEAEGGASAMIADGLFARFPVESVYGLHNWPDLPAGTLAVHRGAVMAGTCRLAIRVEGRGCHAAIPHQGIDPIVAASHLVTQLQTVKSRFLSPLEQAVISVTRMEAGSAWNVIPDAADLFGTLRSFDEDVENRAEAAIAQLCRGVAASFGAEISVAFDRRYPPTINHAQSAEQCRRAAERCAEIHQTLTGLLPAMTAEDFSYMLQERPGCYVWLGNGQAEKTGISGQAAKEGEKKPTPSALHSPRYDFNDAILPIGVAYWVSLVKELLPP